MHRVPSLLRCCGDVVGFNGLMASWIMLGEGERLRQIAPLLSDWPWCSRLKASSLITLINPIKNFFLTLSVKVYNWKYEFTPTLLICKPRSHNFSISLPFRRWVCRVTRTAPEPIPTPIKSIPKRASFNYTSYRRSRRYEARLTYVFKGKCL